MYEEPALFRPDRQHGRACFSCAAFPYMGPGCCIALILVRSFEQPLTGLTELDACPSEPLVQHSGSHSQFFRYLCGRVGALGLQDFVVILNFWGL